MTKNNVIQLVVCLSGVLFFCLRTDRATAQSFTVSGTIKDASDGEDLIGAVVMIEETGGGTATNEYGFYSLKLQRGVYHVIFRYVGYDEIKRELTLDKNVTLNIQLSQSAANLDEVVIVANDDQSSIDVQNIEMSVNRLSGNTIKKIPALLGEADVIKSLQFLPGVSTAGEGTSGFNVRGGSVGQNLILLDEAPVYNSSHMLGFFSVFNPDAVKDVKLYKGGIPAQYGGRLSSVLDVRLNEGNSKKMEVNGGVGLIFSRLSVEGPIVKNKSSFLLAARRSYIDGLASLVTDDFGLNFYDVTLKTNYQLDSNNRIYLSGYLGRDNFGITDDSEFNWGNKTATLRWNNIIGSRLFANYSLVYSNYNYRLGFSEDEDNSYNWKAGITNYQAKSDFSFFVNRDSEINFGLDGAQFVFDPSNTKGITNGEAIDNSLEKKYAYELAAYAHHKISITDRFELQYGLRFSNFRYVGEGTAYMYNDTIPGKRRTVISEKTYKAGETIASYFNPEPRLSVKYSLDKNRSVKASFNRMSQYVHFISNTTGSNPLNIWTPSTKVLKPSTGYQVAAGYFQTFGNDKYEMSAETFFKKSKNEVDYINGAELLGNEYLEGDLLSGLGRSYGLELYVQKKTGSITGWVSYTLSRSEMKVDGINRGNWYATRFDQTHNLKVIASYQFNEKWSITSDFVYTTGSPTTFPDQRYMSQGILIPYNSNDSRNNMRMDDYHRLDVSFRMEGKKFKRNGNKRKIEDYWVFSIYNVYGRKNAFSIYFSQDDGRYSSGQVVQSEAHQVSIIGTMVPSFSYNFKF